MAKFQCKCDNILSLKSEAEDYEFYLTKIHHLHAILDKFYKGRNEKQSEFPWIAARDFQIDDFTSHISHKSLTSLICPFCRRLWIFEENRTTEYVLAGETEIDPDIAN